mmetsp:Transcript_6778/g.21050  ORF Transcript_6778/g.21050 Transcript_6778/m.21050 type:complete len:299 (+) Transcript_6778:109-1005(+)
MAASGAREAMLAAASSVGFFTVVNHGIDAGLIEETFATAESFFEGSPSEKSASSPYASKLNAGYEYMKQVRPSTGLPDVKESIQVTTRESSMVGRWPSAAFESKVRAFVDAAHALARELLGMLGGDLNLPDAHTVWTENSQCTLRMLRYPPIAVDEAPPEGSMRAGAHTDWGCVTLLFQLPGNAGLECASKNGSGWIKVDPTEGGVAVNVGDMLSRWTDGALKSNLHRVRMPATPEEAAKSRYSIAWFAQADKHQPITVKDPLTGRVTYQATAGEYIQSRLQSNYGGGGRRTTEETAS